MNQVLLLYNSTVICHFSCQVQLIKALQGTETDATMRHLVATTISELDLREKTEFVESLRNVSVVVVVVHGFFFTLILAAYN